MWERFGLSVMQGLEPERAHGLAIKALRSGLVPAKGVVEAPALRTDLAGLTLANPVGLAAGFDKNAEVIVPLSRAGFGFLEVGAATPRPQFGNAKPRLFRLSEDQGAINRFGFNNQGMDIIANRLAEAKARTRVPVGLNLGANKDSDDRSGDFAKVLTACGPHIDFASINISSPNTERLRDLHGKDALKALLARVQEANAGLLTPCPLFLKIAPDLAPAELEDVVEAVLEARLSGIIATNTTLSRDNLQSHHKSEAGGLSGAPLFERSTRVLAQTYKLTQGRVPIIGVGGVSTVGQAWEKLRAGATAVQLYTGLVYGGLSLASRIAEGLAERCAREGLSHISEVTGQGASEWT